MGLSPRNLWDMKRFYLRYCKNDKKVRQAVAVLPWSHNRGYPQDAGSRTENRSGLCHHGDDQRRDRSHAVVRSISLLPRNGREALQRRVAAGKQPFMPVLAPRNGCRAPDVRFETRACARARERENRRGPKHNPVEHNSLSLNKIEVATCRQRGARGYYHYTGNQEVTLHGQYGQNGQRPKSHASPHKSSYFAQRQPYQATTAKQRSGRRKESPMKPPSMMAAWTGGITEPPRIAMIRPAAPILASSPTSSRAIP